MAPPPLPPPPSDLKPLEIGFFGLCTVLCLVGGVVTVAAKNPIRGAMGLLVTIVGIAGMYLLLSAELLAAIQVVVYAGAVVILFLFVIMLLGPSAAESSDAKGAASRYAGAALMVLASSGLLWLIMRMGGKTLTTFAPPEPGMGTIEVIGREMFTRTAVPFQICGVLLLVAVVGAVAVARGRGKEDGPIIAAKKASASPAQAKDVPLLTHGTRLEVSVPNVSAHGTVSAGGGGSSKATLQARSIEEDAS
ncbi:MAG: NADH-quinone oxidoreductase subunit J [Polyangiaceae bacterium]